MKDLGGRSAPCDGSERIVLPFFLLFPKRAAGHLGLGGVRSAHTRGMEAGECRVHWGGGRGGKRRRACRGWMVQAAKRQWVSIDSISPALEHWKRRRMQQPRVTVDALAARVRFWTKP